MKKIKRSCRTFAILLAGLFINTSLFAELTGEPKNLVGISLVKVMEYLSVCQEAIREEEPLGAILLFPAYERVGEATVKLKEQMKLYEENRKVKVDFITASYPLPDYTEDFLKYVEQEDGE